jgi:hypothetical protein
MPPRSPWVSDFAHVAQAAHGGRDHFKRGTLSRPPARRSAGSRTSQAAPRSASAGDGDLTTQVWPPGVIQFVHGKSVFQQSVGYFFYSASVSVFIDNACTSSFGAGQGVVRLWRNPDLQAVKAGKRSQPTNGDIARDFQMVANRPAAISCYSVQRSCCRLGLKRGWAPCK